MNSRIPGAGNSPTSRILWRQSLALVAVAGLWWLGALCAQERGQGKIRNFKMIDLYDASSLGPRGTNQLKSLVSASEAEPQSKTLVRARGVRAEKYSPDGQTNFIAKAPECLLDTVRHELSSPGRLTVESGNGQFFTEGEGFFCRQTNFTLTISNRVQTLLRRGLFGAATNPLSLFTGPAAKAESRTNAERSTNQWTRIRSHRCYLDSQFNLVIYAGQVRVEDPELDLVCETLTLNFSTNGTLETITAEQNVAITNKQDRSHALGDRAVYSISQAKEVFELTGREARWVGSDREVRAQTLFFDRRNNVLRADQDAYLKLPRAALYQNDWLLIGSPLPGKPPTPPPAATNQFVELTARVLTLFLPATNRPAHQITAETNVVIVSPADQSHATSEHATFDEATGKVELTGNAVWQAGERIVQGDALTFDRTNRVFTARRQAYLKFPLAALGDQTGLRPLPVDPAKAVVAPRQFIEVFTDDFEYQTNLLCCRENVRANYLEGDTVRATLACGFLSVQLSNQVQSILAQQHIVIDQLPVRSPDGRTVEKKLNCEFLLVTFTTNGCLAGFLAETNVTAQQKEVRTNSVLPIHTVLTAEKVSARFFPHTNLVEEAVAVHNVSLVQGERRAQGATAVYHGTNEVLELSGHPTGQMPGVRIDETEAILWDRLHNRLSLRGKTKLKPIPEGEGLPNGK